MTEEQLPGGRTLGAVRAAAAARHDRDVPAVRRCGLAGIAEPAGFGDPADRRRRFRLFLDAYGYAGDRTAIREAILGRVERNVAVIRRLAEHDESTFQRLLPWAADLERSGAEVAALPDEFWAV
jgi:hypothetical protein